MAHKKAGGSTSLGRESISKRLGIKRADGQFATAGMILVRQRGTKYHPGSNVRVGSDDTLYAALDGFVKMKKMKAPNFYGRLKQRTFISVIAGERKVSAKAKTVKTKKAVVKK